MDEIASSKTFYIRCSDMLKIKGIEIGVKYKYIKNDLIIEVCIIRLNCGFINVLCRSLFTFIT